MQNKYAEISISLDLCSEIALDPIPVPHVEEIYPICCASNKEHVSLHRVLQPAVHELWHNWVEDNPDKHYRDTMYTYLSEGVHIGFKGPQESIISHNWPSCDTYADAVQQFINKNKQLRRVEGPFHKKNLPANFRCSPLRAFKTRHSEKIRVGHH